MPGIITSRITASSGHANRRAQIGRPRPDFRFDDLMPRRDMLSAVRRNLTIHDVVVDDQIGFKIPRSYLNALGLSFRVCVSVPTWPIVP